MARPPLLLAFDTSGQACSAALWRDGEILASAFEIMPRGQSERLLPMIAEVLKAGGADYSDLGGIGVTNGPGAFTGLRIGLATAQGLALALGLKVAAISTFEAHMAALPGLAHNLSDRHQNFLVAVASKRSELFCALCDKEGRELREPLCLSPSDIAPYLPEGPLVILGDAAQLCAEGLEASLVQERSVIYFQDHARADTFIERVASTFDQRADRPEALMPSYLRPPDTSAPKTPQAAAT